MIIYSLPSYSAERYFLLSEVEQLAKFEFLDESKEADQVTRTNRFGILYILWDIDHQSDEIIHQKVTEVFALCQAKIQYPDLSPIFIDAIIASQGNWNGYHSRIEELLIWLTTNFPNRPIVIGVVNDCAGTAALTHLQEFLQEIFQSASTRKCSLTILSHCREEMMGHNPLREPDASSDVLQKLCFLEAQDASLQGLLAFYESVAGKLDLFVSPFERETQQLEGDLFRSLLSAALGAILVALIATLACYYKFGNQFLSF